MMKVYQYYVLVIIQKPYIKECLNSIKNQICNTNIELVWVNDGSDKLNTVLLKKLLEDFDFTIHKSSLFRK